MPPGTCTFTVTSCSHSMSYFPFFCAFCRPSCHHQTHTRPRQHCQQLGAGHWGKCDPQLFRIWEVLGCSHVASSQPATDRSRVVSFDLEGQFGSPIRPETQPIRCWRRRWCVWVVVVGVCVLGWFVSRSVISVQLSVMSCLSVCRHCSGSHSSQLHVLCLLPQTAEKPRNGRANRSAFR
ncbi:hypothetical protein GE09DRAFT_348685 [Coniochaeta sp. 2T2.1]|nr:hypothetical protein GE09DRAFT_348685 [Coniochaeta sp. 2T2.1]